MRVCLTLSYDGSCFYGFQQQKKGENTVMNALFKANKKLNIHAYMTGSGRTDKGVHANNQTVHVDIPFFWRDLDKLTKYYNRLLHPNLHVKNIRAVREDFHARFSAYQREYRYILSHEKFSPFCAPYVWHYANINIQKLNYYLALFRGIHNFEMFKKNGTDVQNFIRTIYLIYAYSYKKYTIIKIISNGFLRSQVRMIVNAAVLACEDRISKQQIIEQLQCQKKHTSALAPSNGLYLHRIYYDKKYFMV